jgi:hypothetical protein
MLNGIGKVPLSFQVIFVVINDGGRIGPQQSMNKCRRRVVPSCSILGYQFSDKGLANMPAIF